MTWKPAAFLIVVRGRLSYSEEPEGYSRKIPQRGLKIGLLGKSINWFGDCNYPFLGQHDMRLLLIPEIPRDMHHGSDS